MAKSRNSAEISVVVPAYKCEKCVEELYSRLIAVLEKITGSFEIIFVNDASPENDWEIISAICKKDERVRGINFSKNFGQHRAITAGIDFANGDWVVVMDCDLQDEPEEIEKLFSKAIEGYDIVLARRSSRKDNIIRKKFSRMFAKVFMYFTETNVDDTVANFGIYSKKVIESYRELNEQNRNFTLLIQWLGFSPVYVNVEHSKRLKGKSSYTYKKLFNLALDSIISQSNKPLRISIKFGFVMSLISLIYGLFLVIRHYAINIYVQGWTSLMVSLFFLSGLLLANMGLLGLYIGKIFDEAKNRPIYIISELINVHNKNSEKDTEK